MVPCKTRVPKASLIENYKKLGSEPGSGDLDNLPIASRNCHSSQTNQQFSPVFFPNRRRHLLARNFRMAVHSKICVSRCGGTIRAVAQRNETMTPLSLMVKIVPVRAFMINHSVWELTMTDVRSQMSHLCCQWAGGLGHSRTIMWVLRHRLLSL